MATQMERAALFASLHVRGNPVILYNIWDAGGAKALEEIGAKAVATGSVAFAMANGYADGEHTPLDVVMAGLERIVATVDIPVTADLEGGYGTTPEAVAETAARAIAAGVVGMNYEDQVIGGGGLHPIDAQSERIRAIRAEADRHDLPFYINARSDVFLKVDAAQHSAEHLDEALRRAEAYAAAGASGFFAPGLRDLAMIKTLCERSPLPVNITGRPGGPSAKELADLGVARISHGGGPYRAFLTWLKESARQAMLI